MIWRTDGKKGASLAGCGMRLFHLAAL